MRCRHADERVDIVGPVQAVQETLPVGEPIADALLALGRGVDDLTRPLARQGRARQPAHAHLAVFDPAAHHLGRTRAKRPSLQGPKALQQGMPVAQGFLGRWIGRAFRSKVLEQLVRGGDDILDLGTGLRFEQRQRVDQHRRIRNQLRGLFEFSQGRSCRNTLLQNGFRLQLCGWREPWKIVVRLIWPPR